NRPLVSFRRIPAMLPNWLRLTACRSVRSALCCQRMPSAFLAVEVLEGRQLLSTFTVTNTDDAGPGSFRQAILGANANPGRDTIAFSIGGGGPQPLRPTSPLPTISDAVTINGTTQPGFGFAPLIELTGTDAGSTANGLTITAGNSSVIALVINSFKGYGIALLTNGNNLIATCYIGTDLAGTQARGNGG